LLSITVYAPGIARELVQFDDAETKQRYEYLLENMRCLVCQNQTLADSDAGLAGDLRHEIERMLRQGDSNKQIVNFLVDRYGDFVLYNPPLKTSTLLLWFAPVLLLIIFALAISIYLRKHKDDKSGFDLNNEQRALAMKLLNEDMNSKD
jgi:cytochrome c-type biogenesis protein CcmH